MNKSILQDLLKQYEQKRFLHEHELEDRKSNLYADFPRLKSIDVELANISINTAKSILASNKNQIEDLKNSIEKLKKEKENILKAAGKDVDYLSLHYDCNLCNDTGYLLEDSTTVMCKCLKQKIFDIEYNKSNLNLLKNQTFENFNLDLYSDNKNKEKYNSNLSPRKNIENIKNIAINFVENFDAFNTRNLLFSGGTGLRKNLSF